MDVKQNLDSLEKFKKTKQENRNNSTLYEGA